MAIDLLERERTRTACLRCGGSEWCGCPHEPSTIGPYQVRRRLEPGQVGELFECHDPGLDRRLAVRLFRGLDDVDVSWQQGLRAARALGRLRHPNVAAMAAVGRTAAAPFLATEWVDGPSVVALLSARGRLEPRDALLVVRQAARGLEAASAEGALHLDVRPGNLLVARTGVVKVVDFGLGATLPDDLAAGRPEPLTGDPGYLAPERVQGLAPDARADVYSLGMTLLEMVTGAPPFPGSDLRRRLVRHVVETPRGLDALSTGAPALADLVARLVAKDPDDRPRSWSELRERIDDALGALAEDDAPRLGLAAAAMPPDAAASSVASGSWRGLGAAALG